MANKVIISILARSSRDLLLVNQEVRHVFNIGSNDLTGIGWNNYKKVDYRMCQYFLLRVLCVCLA